MVLEAGFRSVPGGGRRYIDTRVGDNGVDLTRYGAVFEAFQDAIDFSGQGHEH